MKSLLLASGLVAAVALCGCRMDTHKDGNGHENVKIATPFGGMSVKTDDKAIQGTVGLSVYPGAVLEKKEKNNDSSADVNMSFGNFHLGVKALSYQTPDAQDKVLAFYKKDMAHFGSVIECHGTTAVGTPTRTQEGLTCDDDSKGHVHVDEGKSADELKAGSKLHQHIVSVEPKNGGTKIGLVMLDLPGGLGGDDDKQ